MRKVKNIGALLLIAVGVVYLVSIGNAKPFAPSLKVGVLVSDSGALAFAGPIQRAAVRLAVKDMAIAKEPVKVDVSYVDVGDTEEENKQAVGKLKSLGVDVVIAPIESESAEILVESNAKSPLPVISTASLADDLGSGTSKGWFFRLATSPSQDSVALANYVVRSGHKNVLVVFGSQPQSRAQLRSLSYGLILRGVGVQTAAIKEVKSIAKSKPNALVLLSMEESLTFFGAIPDWVEQIPQVYLVPSNLGDYSAFPWAKILKGTQALSPKMKIDPSFRSNLAKALGNQSLTGPRSMTLLALAQRTYDSVVIAAQALLEAKSDSPERLKSAISKTEVQGKKLFDEYGFLEQTEYSVLKYGSSGRFSPVSLFSPN
jgi:branched-chain amino acid transport system substrate-binding protein